MSPASVARRTSTPWSSCTAAATVRPSRRRKRRRSSATWSLRLRPVCSLAPAGPARSVTRRSMAVWMSSSVGTNTNVPSASSLWTVSSAVVTAATSSSVSTPTWPSMATCARDPSMSSPARRRSKSRLLVNASSSSAGPSAKRPCQSGRGSRSLIRLSFLGGSLLARHRLDAEAPEPHEPGGVLVAESVLGGVGRELVVVQPVLGATAGDEAAARLEAESHLPRHRRLRCTHERVEGPPQRRVPQPVVDELGVARLEASLLAHEVALERDRLEVGVGEEQGERTRALVDLAALDAHPAVLDHVDAAPAVRPHRGAHRRDELVQGRRRAVEGHRDATLEADHQLPGLPRRVSGLARDGVHLLGGLDPRIFEDPALDRSSPQVLVDRVRAVLAHADRDAVLRRVLDRVLPRQAPDPHGREHLEVRRERSRRYFEPHLVVALSCTAVRDRVRIVLTGGADQMPRDDRPRQCRDERVLA